MNVPDLVAVRRAKPPPACPARNRPPRWKSCCDSSRTARARIRRTAPGSLCRSGSPARRRAKSARAELSGAPSRRVRHHADQQIGAGGRAPGRRHSRGSAGLRRNRAARALPARPRCEGGSRRLRQRAAQGERHLLALHAVHAIRRSIPRFRKCWAAPARRCRGRAAASGSGGSSISSGSGSSHASCTRGRRSMASASAAAIIAKTNDSP